MKEYLVVYVEPTDYYVKVVKYGWSGEEEDTIKFKEIQSTIIEANNKREVCEKFFQLTKFENYEIINIIDLESEVN